MADAQMMKLFRLGLERIRHGTANRTIRRLSERARHAWKTWAGKLREMFGEHTEEAEEAIAIVQNIFHAEREAVIGRHAA